MICNLFTAEQYAAMCREELMRQAEEERLIHEAKAQTRRGSGLRALMLSAILGFLA